MPQAATMQPRPMRRAVVMSQPVPGTVHDQVAALLSGKNSWVTRRPMTPPKTARTVVHANQ